MRRSSVIASEVCRDRLPAVDPVECAGVVLGIVKQGRRALFHLAVQEILMPPFAAAGLDIALTMEGHIGAYAEKIDLVLDVVDMEGVSTICEVGFNAGHSALLFLGFNQDTSLLSFDLGHHDYTWVSANTVLELFPGRHTLILGDSRMTVPSFHSQFPDHQCDVLLIDGGHELDVVAADLRNGQGLVRPEKHVLLVDDTNDSDVFAVWKEMTANGSAVESRAASGEFNVCWHIPNIAPVLPDGQVAVEQVCSGLSPADRQRGREWSSSMALGRYNYNCNSHGGG